MYKIVINNPEKFHSKILSLWEVADFVVVPFYWHILYMQRSVKEHILKRVRIDPSDLLRSLFSVDAKYSASDLLRRFLL